MWPWPLLRRNRRWTTTVCQDGQTRWPGKTFLMRWQELYRSILLQERKVVIRRNLLGIHDCKSIMLANFFFVWNSLRPEECLPTTPRCIGGKFCDEEKGRCVDKLTDSSSQVCDKTHPCADGFECRDGTCVKGSDATCSQRSSCSNSNCNCLNGDEQHGRCSGAAEAFGWT